MDVNIVYTSYFLPETPSYKKQKKMGQKVTIFSTNDVKYVVNRQTKIAKTQN